MPISKQVDNIYTRRLQSGILKHLLNGLAHTKVTKNVFGTSKDSAKR
jgi:hypothetical protein